MARFSQSEKNHLFWWSPPSRRYFPLRRENAGDYLSPVIVKRLLAERGYQIAQKRPLSGRLFAIGSILHFSQTGDIVWGSGVNGKIPAEEHNFEMLDVRAVRGPRTREFLNHRGIECPPIYGDPALLLPSLFPAFKSGVPTRDYVVIPHMHDTMALKKLDVDRRNVLLPTIGWRRFVSGIVSSRLVLSASLHGLIIAEAFGLPARLLRLSENEALFKYDDYYLGTGRSSFHPSTSVSEGLTRGGESPPVFDPQPLLKAFPYDLWER